MLSILISFTSFFLTFLFPLALTAKSVQTSKYSKFLFNYWIYYVVIVQLESNLFIKLLDISFGNVFQILSLSFKIWLFYQKGCLILTYYYLNNVVPAIQGYSSFETIEIRFIEPLIMLFTNPINLKLWNVIHGFVIQMAAKNLIGEFLLTMSNYFHELSIIRPRENPYLLDYSLNYFCTIDNQQVFRNYKLTNRFVNLFNLNLFQVPEKRVRSFTGNEYQTPISSPQSNQIQNSSNYSHSQQYSTPQNYGSSNYSTPPSNNAPQYSSHTPKYATPTNLSPRMSPLSPDTDIDQISLKSLSKSGSSKMLRNVSIDHVLRSRASSINDLPYPVT